jgi:hypothetical protein
MLASQVLYHLSHSTSLRFLTLVLSGYLEVLMIPIEPEMASGREDCR